MELAKFIDTNTTRQIVNQAKIGRCIVGEKKNV